MPSSPHFCWRVAHPAVWLRCDLIADIDVRVSRSRLGRGCDNGAGLLLLLLLLLRGHFGNSDEGVVVCAGP
jgi:hypothetical protein